MNTDTYEGVMWAAIIEASIVFILYGWLFMRLNKIAKSRKWHAIFSGAAFICYLFGILRLIITLQYYEDLLVRTSLPITGMVSWLFIALCGLLIVRWIEQAAKRIAMSQAGADLFDRLIDEAVTPVLNGEAVDPGLLNDLREKRAALTAAASVR